MATKIFHTADLHLGLKFTRGYPPALQQSLVNARYEAMERMVEISNSKRCDLFVIAGDLFDNLRVSKKNVLRAADIIRQFEGHLALVLPGNHDYVQPDDQLWDIFRSQCGENVLILDTPQRYDLNQFDLDVEVFAAPCNSKHSQTNALSWIGKAIKATRNVTIGIAHGSLKGVSPDFDKKYYPMTQEELRGLGVDAWLLGHTHIRFPDGQPSKKNPVFFPSTPEPDGFDCRHGGFAWIIDVANHEVTACVAAEIGKYRFHSFEVEIRTNEDFRRLQDRLSSLSPLTDLLQLVVKGRASSDLYYEVVGELARFEKKVAYLEKDISGFFKAITQADIDRDYTQDSFPHKILSQLAKDKLHPLALQLTYDMLNEVRQ